MSTKHPKLKVILEPALMKRIQHIAKIQGVSTSIMARDLIKEALETYEDGQWQKIIQTRETTFIGKKSLTHSQIWQ